MCHRAMRTGANWTARIEGQEFAATGSLGAPTRPLAGRDRRVQDAGMHNLRLEGTATLSQGYLYWRVVNTGEEAAPTQESMGDVEIVLRPSGEVVISRSPSPLSQPLEPGDSEGYQVDLGRVMQADGDYSVHIYLPDGGAIIHCEVRSGVLYAI
jgi:hypothetical protein